MLSLSLRGTAFCQRHAPAVAATGLTYPKKEKSGLSVGRSQGLGCLSQRGDVHALQPHQEFSARCDAHGHMRGQHTNFH